MILLHTTFSHASKASKATARLAPAACAKICACVRARESLASARDCERVKERMSVCACARTCHSDTRELGTEYPHNRVDLSPTFSEMESTFGLCSKPFSKFVSFCLDKYSKN